MKCSGQKVLHLFVSTKRSVHHLRKMLIFCLLHKNYLLALEIKLFVTQ